VLDHRRTGRPGDQDVARLHVAVDQAFRVRGVERPCDAIDHHQCVVEGERRFVDQAPKIGALDVAHRDVQAAEVLIRLVDGKDVRRVEGGRQLGLPDESVPEPVVVGNLRREHLEGDLPLETGVPGQVHDTHAAPPEDAIDAVASELASRCSVHCGRTLPYFGPLAARHGADLKLAGSPCGAGSRCAGDWLRHD
jgi:hypothetical protein